MILLGCSPCQSAHVKAALPKNDFQQLLWNDRHAGIFKRIQQGRAGGSCWAGVTDNPGTSTIGRQRHGIQSSQLLNATKDCPSIFALQLKDCNIRCSSTLAPSPLRADKATASSCQVFEAVGSHPPGQPSIFWGSSYHEMINDRGSRAKNGPRVQAIC